MNEFIILVAKPDIDKLYETIKTYHEEQGHSDGKGLDLVLDPQVLSWVGRKRICTSFGPEQLTNLFL